MTFEGSSSQTKDKSNVTESLLASDSDSEIDVCFPKPKKVRTKQKKNITNPSNDLRPMSVSASASSDTTAHKIREPYSSVEKGTVMLIQNIPSFKTSTSVQVNLILHWRALGKQTQNTGSCKLKGGDSAGAQESCFIGRGRVRCRSYGHVTLSVDDVLQGKYDLNITGCDKGTDAAVMEDFNGKRHNTGRTM